MALAGAALLGVVSTFTWSNVLKSGKADALLLGQNVSGHEDPTGDEDGLSISRWDLLDNGTGQARSLPSSFR